MECTRVSATCFLFIAVCSVLGCSAAVRKSRSWAIDDHGCRTPGRGVGSCIGINECKPMLDFLEKNSEYDNRTEKFLDGFLCGYENNSTKVCCPLTPIKAGWVVDDEGCRTPDLGVGDCIGIQSCQPMLDLINSLPAADAETKRILRGYLCGYDNNNEPKVCCPPGPIRLPDVTNHRNANLLPIDDCGVTPNLDRIINGNKTQLFEFPWMVALKYNTKKGVDFRCGGTLINSRYILTAAHCVKTSSIELIGVRLGEHDLGKEMDCEYHPLSKKTTCAPPVQDFDVTVADAIIHPNYNDTPNANDIALIRLRRNANTSVDSVSPICLPFKPESRSNALKKKLTVTGWGATETGFRSQDLLKVTLPVIPNDQCIANYQNIISISEAQLCAGGKNTQDSCAGDSGGPLMDRLNFDGVLRTVQYGVVSFGPKFCAIENRPGVYTRITSYLNWILDNVNK